MKKIVHILFEEVAELEASGSDFKSPDLVQLNRLLIKRIELKFEKR